MFNLAYASNTTRALYQTPEDHVDEPGQPIFRLAPASNSLLTTYQATGKPPERKVWDWTTAQAATAGFTLKTAALSDIESKKLLKLEQKKQRDKFLGPSNTSNQTQGIVSTSETPVASGADATTLPGTSADASPTAGLSASSSAPALGSANTTRDKPISRAEKYYQALLKAEFQRNERHRKEHETEVKNKAEGAAAASFAAAVALEGPAEASDSEADRDSSEDIPEAGTLVPYDGALKVEVEVVVMRAPGVEKSETESSTSDKASTRTPSSHSSVREESEAGMDISKELQALQEEFHESELAESEGSDGLPEGLRQRQVANIDDADDKRVALGLGGTAFFVPDVERYAMAPSLLPPPPHSLAGRRRLRLKPRLPLEVSRNRWRDEHPSIGAEPAYSPDYDERISYENKMCMVDLFAGVQNVMTQIPRPDGVRRPPPEKLFDLMLDKELRNSRAWRTHIKRERINEIARKAAERPPDPLLDRKSSNSGTTTPSSTGRGPSRPPPAAPVSTNLPRGENPPSPPEAGGAGSGLMGVAPGIRAGI